MGKIAKQTKNLERGFGSIKTLPALNAGLHPESRLKVMAGCAMA
ncbi:hypothetical protein ABAC402_15040 [Asticcacaulis sp. AC402]|nr:hypothetical protein ABAC402_15040 [Asticcacaulis sp. AC402]